MGVGCRLAACFISLMLVLLVVPSPSFAADITVCTDNCDTDRIQDAIDSARPGSTIAVALDAYRECLKIDRKTLYLDFGGSTLKGCDDNAVIQIYDAPGVILENVIIEGHDNAFIIQESKDTLLRNVTARGGNSGLKANNAAGLVVRDSEFSRNSEMGIQLVDSENSLIVSTTASNNGGPGIFVVGGKLNRLEGVTADSNNLFGIGLFGSTDNSINGSVAKRNRQAGITLQHGAMRNSITGNTLEYNEVGFSAYHGSEYNTMSGNVMANNVEEYGITLQNRSKYNTFTGNLIHSNMREGVLFNGDSSGNVFENNTVSSNGMEGIKIMYSSGNALRNNQVMDNGGYGITVQEDSTGNEISHNYLCGNEIQEIYNGGDNSLAGNTFCGGTGIPESQVRGVNSWVWCAVILFIVLLLLVALSVIKKPRR